jgi:predicted AlkP superfamily phosphohydrolase/phosphomutase
MSRVAIIGIDGLDPFLIHKWRDDLPNFSSMYKDLQQSVLESTFPPDSICAWTSIFTGENPAEHGLLESIDYLSAKKTRDDESRSSYIKGKTFWDVAGKKGKKVCIINPFLAYPAWEVNGVMISGPVFEGGALSVFPEGFLDKYNFPQLGGIVDFPDKKNLPEFIKKTQSVTEELAEAGLKVYQDHDYDLYFITFLTLDRIKHFLWRFTDKEDIYYPGENPFQDSIKHFYMLFDKIVGRYKSSLRDDTTLMVISDHGHRRRCQKCLNLNELFRLKGYLSTSGSGVTGAVKKIIERTKVLTIAFMSTYGLQDWIYKIAKFIPNRKALKKSTYLINKAGSPVTLSNVCGTNPFGGVDISAATAGEYEKLREQIIDELMSLNITLGANTVKWAKKREELYRGVHENRLPDVLFELDGEYGVGMDLFTPLASRNYTHKKISGGHKREGVLLIYRNNEGKIKAERPASVMDMKNYILNLIGAY